MDITQKLIILAAFIILPNANQVFATPILTFSGGDPLSPAGDTIGGWELEVTSSIRVDGLGVWDGGGNGLDRPHDVGLWTLSGDLLAATTVDNTSSPEANGAGPGRWLFSAIATLILDPGHYVLGGAFVDNDTDLATIFGTTSTVAGVNFVNMRQETDTSTLTFPGEVIFGANGGVLGPNLRLAEIPLSGTLSITVLGLAVLGHRRRR